MSKLLDLTPDLRFRREFVLFDEFFCYGSTNIYWTSLATGSVTVAAGATGYGGTVVITHGGTTEQDGAVATTNKPFLFQAASPLAFESLIQFSEQNTNKAQVAAGFGSVIGSANFLVTGAAGPATSFSGACIYKISGSTVWKTISSNGATQSLNVSTTTAGGTTPQVLRVEVQPVDTLKAEVTYYVNDQLLRNSSNVIIKDTVLFASAVAMQAGVYSRQQSTAAEVTTVDYIYAAQLRQSGPV